MWSRIVCSAVVAGLLGLLADACGGGGGGGTPCDPASPPNVAGTWVLSAPQVDSDCPDDITNAFLNALFTGSAHSAECAYRVTQSGPNVTIANHCGGAAKFVGCADDDGCVDATWPFSSGPQGCKGTTVAEFTSDLSTSSSDAEVCASFTFPAACGISDCSMDVTASFTEGS